MSQSTSDSSEAKLLYSENTHSVSEVVSPLPSPGQAGQSFGRLILSTNSASPSWRRSSSPQPLVAIPAVPVQDRDESGTAPLEQGVLSCDSQVGVSSSRSQSLQDKYQKRGMTASEHERDDGRHGRRATRRGPMDEMRQLVRILVKIIPQSAKNIRSCDEGGGGNRISEDQIKQYLSSTLGDAPQPKWGVPEGWSSYLAEVFSWVTGRMIRKDQAARCAKREPGRSWEAIDSELAKLGILPSTWPLPLSKEGMGSALVPAAQYSSSPSSSAQKSGSPKRSADGSLNLFEGSGKRLRGDGFEHSTSNDKDEVALWSDALHAVNLALGKAGSSDTLEQQMAVAKLKAEIQSKVQVPSIVPQPSLPMFMTSQPQLVPISVPGPNGQVQTAYTVQMQAPGQLPLAPQGSLDLGSQGFNPAQFFVSQKPGSSAFQAVKPTASDMSGSQGSELLGAPPPLRLSSKSCSSDSEPSSPSDSQEGNSATFPSSHLSTLFRPTALKTEAGFFPCKDSQADSGAAPSVPDVPLSSAGSLTLNNLFAGNPIFHPMTANFSASFPLLQSLSNLQSSFTGTKAGSFPQLHAPVQQAAA